MAYLFIIGYKPGDVESGLQKALEAGHISNPGKRLPAKRLDPNMLSMLYDLGDAEFPESEEDRMILRREMTEEEWEECIIQSDMHHEEDEDWGMYKVDEMAYNPETGELHVWDDKLKKIWE